MDSKMGLASKAGTFNDSMDMDNPKLDKYKEMMQREVIHETNLMRLNFNKEVIAQKMASDGFPGTFVTRFMKTQLASCAALQAKPKPTSMAVPETEADVEAEKRHLMEKLQHSMEAQKKRAAKLGKLSATVLFAESPLPTPRAISARVAAPIAAEIISEAEVGSLEARNLDFFQKLVKVCDIINYYITIII